MSEQIIPTNHTKKALKAGETVLGTMLADIRQPSIMQMLHNAGFQFAIIDNEHGAFTHETIADLSRVAQLVGITPVVRVPDLTYSHLAQSLDAGAQALMLPRITSAEQVEAAVQMMKYPPIGQRGCAFSRAHSGYKGGPLTETMAQANEETMLIVQIETAAAVADVERIVSIPNVDVAFVGPTDLSISLGVPGQLDSLELNTAIAKVLEASQRNNVATAIQANQLDFALRWVERGMTMISAGSEASLLIQAGKGMTSAIRETLVVEEG